MPPYSMHELRLIGIRLVLIDQLCIFAVLFCNAFHTHTLDISAMVDGQKNGLCHFSSEHSAIGIVKEKGVCYVEYRKNGKITRGNPVHSRYVWLGSQWGLDGKSRYYYSVDGDNFIPFGEDYQLVWGNYRGDRIGIYCFNDESDSGFVDVDYFHYR